MGIASVANGRVARLCLFFAALSLAAIVSPVRAATLTFAVHPVLPPDKTRESYTPLMQYLEAATGHRFKLVTNSNFLVHWQLIRRGEYDFILDGPHFTDYRVKKMGYSVLAKYPAVVSYTLVANAEQFILEPSDLIGKSVATSPSPALGALRLAEMYPNPLRQPRLTEANDSLAAAEMAVAGKAAGAIIPAPLVGRFPSLTTVATTVQVPSPAVSAAPGVESGIKEAVRSALLDAQGSDLGKTALEALNITGFEPASDAVYAGQAGLLEGVWGY